MEVYIAARVMSLVAPPFLKVKHRVGGIQDSRVLRAISLIVLELLILASMFGSILGDFVPFSVGSVLVLVTFNYQRREPEAPNFSFSHRSSIISRCSSRPSLAIAVDGHSSDPFATKSLSDAALENGEQHSSKTIDSDFEYARNVALSRIASKRNRRSAKFVRVPPLSAPVAQASDVERGGMREIQGSRLILPSQVSYGEMFERQLDSAVGGLSARRHVVVYAEPQVSTSRPTSGHCKSLNSAFYGSDIIRMDSNKHKDKTKRHMSTTPSADHSEISYSPRESPATPSFKRYSFASLSAPLASRNDDPSVESSVSSNFRTSRQSRKPMRWPTFDEQHFKTVGHANSSTTAPSRPFSGTLSSPPLPPSVRGRRLRGPRPPPATERSPLMPGLKS